MIVIEIKEYKNAIFIASLGKTYYKNTFEMCFTCWIYFVGQGIEMNRKIVVKQKNIALFQGHEWNIYTTTLEVCGVPIHGHIDATCTEHLWVRYISHATSLTVSYTHLTLPTTPYV